MTGGLSLTGVCDWGSNPCKLMGHDWGLRLVDPRAAGVQPHPGNGNDASY